MVSCGHKNLAGQHFCSEKANVMVVSKLWFQSHDC